MQRRRARGRRLPAGSLAGALLLALAGRVAGGEGAGAARPSVLVVILDDVGADWLAPGPERPVVPTLDALAAQGVTFERAWANPVCSPTRACIQTGRHAFRTGMGEATAPHPSFGVPFGIRPEEVTLPELLDLGTGGAYATALFGKWHLSHGLAGPLEHGWGHFAGGATGNLVDGQTYSSWLKTVDGGPAFLRDVYATTDNVDDALAWIAGAGAPWLVMLSFNAPHSPLHRPPAGLYTTPIPPPPAFPGEVNRARYRAAIEAVDTELGRLLASLPAEERARTVVIVTGDNGSPRAVALPPRTAEQVKDSLYEGGLHVPLVVSGPAAWVPHPGTRVDALVSLTDLYATVAELAGVRPEDVLPGVALDSVSLLPYLADPARAPLRDHVLAEQFVTHLPEPFPGPYEGPLCHADAGLAGPGTAKLEVCGIMAYGNAATLRVEGAPPSAPGVLLLSETLAPAPLGSGTVVAADALQVPLTTGPDGSLLLEDVVLHDRRDEHGFSRTYAQVAVEDPRLPGGLALSNAVEIAWLPFNRKAIRDLSGFKLITNLLNDGSGEGEELYDLTADPYESTNLLAAGVDALDERERRAYRGLKKRLERLRPGGAMGALTPVQPSPSSGLAPASR